MKQNNISEDFLISQCHQWLWNNYPKLRLCCWHVANERKTSAIQGAKLKAKGVVAGVPDYVINCAGKTYYIEFKTLIGRLSESQKKLHESMQNQGFNVIVCRTFESFKTFVQSIKS